MNIITFSVISIVVSRSFIRFSLFSSWSFDDFSCIMRRLADFFANKAFLMAWGEVMESSKSNLSRPRRRGAGLEVSGRPVLKQIFLINFINNFGFFFVKFYCVSYCKIGSRESGKSANLIILKNVEIHC